MKALFRGIFSHKEHKGLKDGTAGVMDFGTKEQKVRGGECMEVGMNGQTAKRSNGQTGFSRKGRKERKEGERMEAGMNNPTIQRPNDSTIQRSNGPTIQRSNGPTIQRSNGPTVLRSNGRTMLARWAAVAAVAAAGVLLGSAREAQAA